MTVRAVHSCSAAAEAFPQVPFPDAVQLPSCSAEMFIRDVLPKFSTLRLAGTRCWYANSQKLTHDVVGLESTATTGSRTQCSHLSQTIVCVYSKRMIRAR